MARCRTKGCDNEFQKWSTLQNLCPPCMIAKGRKLERKAERKEHKAAKEKLKTRSDYLKDAQTQFNRYIRARDYGEACVSCGRRDAAKWDAGHYKSVGAYAELRFHEDNCHRQCARPCNSDLSGNIIEYRKGLIERIGLDKVEWLEGSHETKKYQIEEIKEIKAKYSKMANELEKMNLDR